jgi:hypothetical protein
MQMSNTRHTVYDATEAGGSAARNEDRDPPPYTTVPQKSTQHGEHAAEYGSCIA